MKKRYYIITFVLLVGLVLWALRHKKPESPIPPTPVEAQIQPPQPTPHQRPQTTPGAPPPVAPTPPGSSSHPSNTVVVEGVPVSEDVMRYIANVRADPQYDWKQPINFYGKVVDQNSVPVPGASIHFTWNDLSPKGTSQTDTASDENGLFSLTNRQGKRLYVEVSKNGYYTSRQGGIAFEYANPADGVFTPDPSTPVVFQLRQKGAGADLVTSQYGMSPDFPINISRDGTPVNLDVMQRKVGASGQIQISESKPEHGAWQQATAWWFRMEIPGGGFVEQNDEFPFEAPDSGYQPVVQFEFQRGQTNWAEGINKSYYVKFGSPPRYGRFQIQTDISYGGAIIIYAVNPDGSRNLESK